MPRRQPLRRLAASPETNRSRIDHRFYQSHPLTPAKLDEVDKDDRVAHDNSGPSDEADHGGRGEERAQDRMGRQDPHQRQRDWRHDDQRTMKDRNQPTTRT